MNEKPWLAALNGTQVIAVQHGCGIGDVPVNCYRDEYDNWVCPSCLDIYGAAIPLAEWGNTPDQMTARAVVDEQSVPTKRFQSIRAGDDRVAVAHEHIKDAKSVLVPCVWEMAPLSHEPPHYQWRCPECRMVADPDRIVDMPVRAVL